MDNSSIDFVALRKVHDSLDWYYGYSDDINAYRAGEAAISNFAQKLSGLAAIDPAATEAFVAALREPENKNYSNTSGQQFREAVERGTAQYKSVPDSATTVDFDALRTQLEAAPDWRGGNYSKDRAKAALESVQNAVKLDLDGTAKLIESLPEAAKSETDTLADIRKVVREGLAQQALRIETEQKIAAGTAIMSASSFDFADLRKQIASTDWSDTTQVGTVAEKIGQATLADADAAKALLGVLALDGTTAEVQKAVSNAVAFGEADREAVPASAKSVDFDALYKQITGLNWLIDSTTVKGTMPHQLGRLKIEAMYRSMEHASDIDPVGAQALRERLSATSAIDFRSNTTKQIILQVLDTALAKPENAKVLGPSVQESEEVKTESEGVVTKVSPNGASAEQTAHVILTAESEPDVKAEHAAEPEAIAKTLTAAEPAAVVKEEHVEDVKADSHEAPDAKETIGDVEAEHQSAEIAAPPKTPADTASLATPTSEASVRQVEPAKNSQAMSFPDSLTNVDKSVLEAVQTNSDMPVKDIRNMLLARYDIQHGKTNEILERLTNEHAIEMNGDKVHIVEKEPML